MLLSRSIKCIAICSTFVYANDKEAIHLATRTANVMARVEPDVKEQAENILDRLGVPASVVINALYKQIIYRNGIPFSLVLPTAPVARDEMTDAEFNAMMQTGLNAAKTDRSRGASEVFADLRRGL